MTPRPSSSPPKVTRAMFTTSSTMALSLYTSLLNITTRRSSLLSLNTMTVVHQVCPYPVSTLRLPTYQLQLRSEDTLLSRSRKTSDIITKGIKIHNKRAFTNQTSTQELARIYSAISTSDVMTGFGPNSSYPPRNQLAIQNLLRGAAKKLGLEYIGYKINPMEGSLYHKYKKNDPVLTDPKSVNKKGWEFTKRIYFGDQNVTLDLKRFKKLLVQAYEDYRMRNSKSGAGLS
ncbi:hypothetical protein Cgig2_013642 [Carnegiea gigantea]|uniref:Uncharacterized protein n=1 Tax=Carnegiea gigantea TaxID=171969 RepID=A0A9Q1KBV3_9CARY|nr:hypothetical protein Cgig2_013642 [Carnegiea gigantea]